MTWCSVPVTGRDGKPKQWWFDSEKVCNRRYRYDGEPAFVVDKKNINKLLLLIYPSNLSPLLSVLNIILFFLDKQLDISKSKLSKINLRYTDLRGAFLNKVDLHGANLNEADLHGAKLYCADLHNTLLSDSDLNGAYLDIIDLHGANLIEADLHGAMLNSANLQGANLYHANLCSTFLSDANLHGVNLIEADLHGADLNGANLHGADLSGANLHIANLENADLHGANLRRADLHGAKLNKADLKGANLMVADLKGANLYHANLHGAVLWDADLHGANLNKADLKGAKLMVADLKGANFINANLSNANITGIQYDSPKSTTPHPLICLKQKYSDEKKGKPWIVKLAVLLSPVSELFERLFKRLKLWTYVPDHYRGIRVETAYGNALFKRFAQDRDYIETYKQKYPRAGWWWWFLTDYGQSWRLMIFWFVVVSLFFGGLFAVLPDGWFQYGPSFIDGVAVPPSWFTPWYFSIVTLTTLGFGDLVPTNCIAQFIVVVEVILGYVLLGLLISVLANKVARRS